MKRAEPSPQTRDRIAANPAEGGREADYLRPGRFIDSDHPLIAAFVEKRAAGESEPLAAAVKLYYAVRDEIRYDPYVAYDDPQNYRASSVLSCGYGFCVGKAALLAAAARARGIPARIAFADVRNHLATPRLLSLAGTDVFIYHGITELFLEGRWVKATPTFNLSLCRKFRIEALDFDGRADALLHPFDLEGRKHMEYLRRHGSYADVPAEILIPAMRKAYPNLVRLGEDERGDFAKEASEGSSAERPERL